MTRVVVLVRYPLSKYSRATLEETARVSRERDVELTVLHIDLCQLNRSVTRIELKRAVEAEFEPLVRACYVVCQGFLVEETILKEVAAKETDIVVTGSRQASHWRRMLRRSLDDPNINVFLCEKLDYMVITARADD